MERKRPSEAHRLTCKDGVSPPLYFMLQSPSQGAHAFVRRFSIPQTQQPYSHMDMDLKRSLIQKLNDVAPAHGLVELSYPSFIRCYGFHAQPFSAADAVEGLRALLDVASGMRMEVEIEGMRNGGEWFGGGQLWDSNRARKNVSFHQSDEIAKSNGNEEPREGDDVRIQEPEWWVKNFWMAYDALSE